MTSGLGTAEMRSVFRAEVGTLLLDRGRGRRAESSVVSVVSVVSVQSLRC